ncbi:MAG: WbuC family cupin fold metalloprotein [Pseudomonadota bacterium]
MTVEVVSSQGKVLCYLVRHSDEPAATQFFTKPEDPLQVGRIVHPQGHVIAPHRHQPLEAPSYLRPEALMVEQGRCELQIFDDQQRLVATRELRARDVAILLDCGHGFRMIEDTVLFEVKPGPYAGAAEKIYLKTST